MFNKSKVLLTMTGGVLVTALVFGGVIMADTVGASARGNAYQSVKNAAFADFVPTFEGGVNGISHRGGPGFPGRGPESDEYLANALGISVESLQEAYSAAGDRAIEEAVAQGIITEEQAEEMKETGRGFHMPRLKEGMRGQDANIDFEALLADELGITVEALQTARQEAAEAGIQAAIQRGDLTQEQADLMEAGKALRDYIDQESLIAEALGISTNELENARQDGTTVRELIEEQGLTFEEFQTAMQAAHEKAVEEAVANGVITQAQADQLREQRRGSGPGGFHKGGCDPSGFRPDGPGPDGSGFAPSGPNPLETESDA